MFDEGRIVPLEVARQAPFANGVVERRGGLFKEVYYRTKELMPPTTLSDLEALIFESSWALQTLVNRSGYSPAQRVLGRQPTLALDTLANQREYHLSCTQDEAWERAHSVRTAARKALMEADAKARVARARLARPRRDVERLKFDKGEPVAVWRHGRRGTTAKVGPCFVVLQDGQTVWVTRRGQLWRCHVGQVFKMAESEKAGIEAVPLELLEAKTRLRYDSEKMRFVDVAQEIQPGDEDGSDRPPDGREPLPEIPVPDPPEPPGEVDLPGGTRPPDGHEPLAEIPWFLF